MPWSGDGSIIYLNKGNRKPSLRVTFKKKLEGSEEMNHAIPGENTTGRRDCKSKEPKRGEDLTCLRNRSWGG